MPSSEENPMPRMRRIPTQRDCLQEVPEGIASNVKGQLPSWLKGTLFRNGPGLTKIGDTEYKHVLDGLALIHSFVMDGSTNSVTYRNKFLRSETYKANMAANRIVIGEVGTRAYPDPCKSLLGRFFAYFTNWQTDNSSVNIMSMGDEVYAMTESPYLWRVDPLTLETKEMVDMSKYIAVHTFTVHAHTDETEGVVYNMGSQYGLNPMHCVIRMPLKAGLMETLQETEIIAKIPVKDRWSPTYYHTFGMSENYIIFVEQPLHINFKQMPIKFFQNKPLTSVISWNPNEKTHFILVNRKTGQIVKTDFYTDTFATFHMINCYEEGKRLLVDICCYDDGNMMEKLYHDTFFETYSDRTTGANLILHTEARRYILPIDAEHVEAEDEIKKTVYCGHEKLTDKGFHTAEFSRINESYDGKKYKFFYAISHRDDNLTQLIKVDCDTKEVKYWEEDDFFPSEPIFVVNPNGVDEDDGVVVSSVLHETIETQGFLLVLDAKSFKEIARANFETPSAISNDVHGKFVNVN